MEMPLLKNAIDEGEDRDSPGSQGSLREGDENDLEILLDADEQFGSATVVSAACSLILLSLAVNFTV